MEHTRCSNSDKDARYVLSCVLLSCSVAPVVSTKLTSATTQLRADAARFPSHIVPPHIAPPIDSLPPAAAVNFNLRSIFTPPARSEPPLGGGTPADTPADTPTFILNLGGITKTHNLSIILPQYLLTHDQFYMHLKNEY